MFVLSQLTRHGYSSNYYNISGCNLGNNHRIPAENFADQKIICRVKTDRGIMRYDSVAEQHHHLYCSETETIADYYDEELNSILENYFRNKMIDNFSVEYVKLQIVGKFTNLNK
ncbi:MAG: transcriptional repressor [Bacteroidales bacterium]